MRLKPSKVQYNVFDCNARPDTVCIRPFFKQSTISKSGWDGRGSNPTYPITLSITNPWKTICACCNNKNVTLFGKLMNSKTNLCVQLIDNKFAQMQNHSKNRNTKQRKFLRAINVSCVLNFFLLLIEGNFVFRRQISKKFNFMHIL